MSCNSTMWCPVELNRSSFNSKQELQDEIEDLKKEYEDAVGNIKMIALATEFNKIVPDGYEPLEYIERYLNGQFEYMEELQFRLHRMYIFLENWDMCHNDEGYAIAPPEETDYYNTAYYDGDEVHTSEYKTLMEKVTEYPKETLRILYCTYKPASVEDIEKVINRGLLPKERKYLEKWLPYDEEKHQAIMAESRKEVEQFNKKIEKIIKSKQ